MLVSHPMIAYDKHGAVFALTEGAELLLHDGDTEGPLWRKTLDDTIVGLGVSSDEVVAVTARGSVTWFGAKTGEQHRRASFTKTVRSAVVDLAADRVVAAGDRIVRLASGNEQELADHAAHAVALAPDGSIVAATDTELVRFAPDGTRTALVYPGVRAIAHHPEGFWVLGLAAKLVRWDGTNEPTHITNLPPGSKLDHVACSARAIAVAWDRHMAVALEWPSKETLGSLQYMERKVEGLDFGPWPWLGVALDLGDGNKFHLVNANLNRSDTHPGRQHHSWLVSVGGGSKPSTAPAKPPHAAAPASAGLSTALLIAIAAIALVVFLAVR